jgi:hypothetical protein
MAVSVQYFIRSGIGGSVLINGSTTPPTAIQASQVYMQKALIIMSADTDVQALFTHNWGLDASAPTYLEPEVFIVAQLTGATVTFMPAFTFDLTSTNVIKVNKLSQASTNGTYICYIRKPHSTGQ